jgi:tetratricopeptide (TPR) repeat protein
VADSHGPALAQLLASASWPVRSGKIPRLADIFGTRPESAPDLAGALSPGGAAVALVPRSSGAGAAAGSADDWQSCSGKTQLAAHYAESQWRARSVDLLLWVDASSPAAILSGFAETVRAMTARRVPGAAESVAASLLSWLARTDRRWLIVFDDLTDPRMLRRLWPAGPGGQVLITAPDSHVVAGLPEVTVAEIGPFTPREAMSYLVGRLSSDPDQRRGAMDLINDLGCQPLALAQATAAIGSSWLTCMDYRERFSRRSALIRQKDHGPPAPGRVTWTLSVDSADYLRPGGAAQSCLVLAALLDGHGVPAPAFTTTAASRFVVGDGAAAGYAAQRSGNVLQTLEQVGLISLDRGGESPAVWMNKVMQRAVLAATPADMFEQAAAAAAAALLELWSDGGAAMHYGPRLRACAEALRRAAGGVLWSGGCHPLLFRTGLSLDEDGLTGPAVDYWREVAMVGDRALGPDHPDSQALAQRLASAYMAAGRAADAIAWCRQMLADWAGRLGPDSPRALAARVNIGRVLASAGQLDQAIRMLSETVSDCERLLGTDHRQSQSASQELAAAYRMAGQIGTAARIYRHTLSQRERAAGPDDPGTIAIRLMLAETYLAGAQAKEAIAQYKRALADCKRSLGADHPDTLRARASLASAYHQTGRMALAVQLYEQARAGSEQALGPDHPDTLAAAVGLASTYYAVGRLTDAAGTYREVVTRGEQVLPAGDPLMRSARAGLAAITGD